MHLDFGASIMVRLSNSLVFRQCLKTKLKCSAFWCFWASESQTFVYIWFGPIRPKTEQNRFQTRLFETISGSIQFKPENNGLVSEIWTIWFGFQTFCPILSNQMSKNQTKTFSFWTIWKLNDPTWDIKLKLLRNLAVKMNTRVCEKLAAKQKND